jgi:hypothetical protein
MEHPLEVWHIPPGTPCINTRIIMLSHTKINVSLITKSFFLRSVFSKIADYLEWLRKSRSSINLTAYL